MSMMTQMDEVFYRKAIDSLAAIGRALLWEREDIRLSYWRDARAFHEWCDVTFEGEGDRPKQALIALIETMGHPDDDPPESKAEQ